MGSMSGDMSSISAHTRGSSNGADVAIDISLRDKLILSGGEIAASGYGAGKAGDIKISAASVEVGGDPIYSAATNIGSRAWSSGHGGNIEITADSLLVKDRAYVGTYALGTGTGGDVRLNVQDLEVRNRGYIYTGSYGLGKGGNLSVTANDILLSQSAVWLHTQMEYKMPGI